MPLEEEQRKKVEDVTSYIKSRGNLSDDEREERSKDFIGSRADELLQGKTVGEIHNYRGVGFNTRDQDKAKEQLREIDNDLDAQIRIVAEGVQHYYDAGVYPPPYYPWRIAVMLRKAKEYELEAQFLDAFNSRFSDGLGKRYRQLVDRATKARQKA